MKNMLKKQLISICIMICLCFMLTGGGLAYAGNKVDGFSEAEVLYGLGIISELPENFCKREGITRAELVRIMTAMSGMADSGLENSGSVYFTDVEDDNEYAQDINIALALGIISGNGDYSFSPDENASYPAMIRMGLSVLGYSAQAQFLGGFPNGYLKLAAKLRLLQSVGTSESVNGAAAAKFLYNMLDTEIAQVGADEDKVVYDSEDGKTLLTERLKMKYTEGVVTRTENVGLFGADETGADTIAIGDEEYHYTGDADRLLGCFVECYYKYDGGKSDFDIVFIRASEDNNILLLDADDIIKYSGGSYSYYNESGKAKNAVIYKGAAFVYNGASVDSGFDMTRLVPDEGTVLLIDNNSDDKYDCVIVNSYVNIVVRQTNTYERRIYDAYKSERNITLEENNYRLYDENNKIIELSAIGENNVISVEKNDNNEYILRLSKKTASGTVTSVDESEKIIRIGDTAYKVSESYISSGEKFFEAGDTGTFLIDIYGRITGKKTERNTDFRFGFITKAGIDDSNVVQPFVKLITLLGEEQRYDFAKTVIIDGAAIKNEEKENAAENKILIALQKGTPGENPTLSEQLPDAQVVRYKLNAENKISEVDTSYVNSDKEDRETTLRRTLTYDKGKNMFYKQTAMNFGGKEIISSDALTLIINLPLSGSAEDDYKISAGSYFKDNNTYDIESFCYTKDKIGADIVVLYEDYTSGSVSDGAVEMIVEETGIALDSDDLPVKQITGYYNGMKVSYVIKESAKLDSDIGEGDLIRFSLNSKSEIIAAQHVYSSASDTITEIKADFDKQLRIVSGYVYKYYDNQIILSRGELSEIENTDVQEKINIKNAKVYIYDKADKRQPVRMGSQSELTAYTTDADVCSKIVIRTSYADGKTILIIK